MGKAKSVPAEAVLGGLLILTSFALSPAVVEVPSTDWVEPVLIWLTICMTTGTRKSTVYQYLLSLLRTVRAKVGCKGKPSRVCCPGLPCQFLGIPHVPVCGYMLPNLSPSPNLYKVQSVYNNNVAL